MDQQAEPDGNQSPRHKHRGTVRPRRRRLIVAAAIAATVILAFLASATIDDHRANGPYLAWKLHLAPLPAYGIGLLMRDSTYRHHFAGQSLQDFQNRLGVPLWDGLQFPPNSYRGDVARSALAARGDHCYWFDSNPEGWNWCVIIRDDKVAGFTLIKG